ncbi:hypothetical protein [Streptomyces sp. NPDC002619]|uniref:hypothetical protein n=1 Tax=Streptomyces sp. NPDC002619 TaxID=3364655 RepID=UPI003676710B
MWLANNPHVHFHFTPVGSSWLNRIEIWFGIITWQSMVTLATPPPAPRSHLPPPLERDHRSYDHMTNLEDHELRSRTAAVVFRPRGSGESVPGQQDTL